MGDNTVACNKGSTSTDSYIPPPTDPYVTYQTPYTRRPSNDNQNPFIEFRRLADSLFSSVFTALPRVLGTEEFKRANIREADEAYVQAFDKQVQEVENRIAEMVRVRTEEAEGFRKKLEQEWEERRRENEKRMEEESKKWDMMRRGWDRCPGLRPDALDSRKEPEIELDLYEGLNAYESASYRPRADTEPRQSVRQDQRNDKKCPWSEQEKKQGSWLPLLGWDGSRRAKKIPLYVPKQSMAEQVAKVNVDWQQYKDEEMDPFNNDDHLVPWLKLSPYSPVSLIKTQAWVGNSGQHQGNHDSHLSINDFPWDEAFEDLIAVHKTGNLPSLVRRLVYWGGPNQWMTDMTLRGSLGQKWEEGFMVAALMGAVDGQRWRGFNGLQEQCIQLAGREFYKTIPSVSNAGEGHGNYDDKEESAKNSNSTDDWIGLAKEAFEPAMLEAYRDIEELAEILFGNIRPVERNFGAHGMVWPTPEEVMNAIMKGETKVEDGDSKEQICETINTIQQPASASHKYSSSSTESSVRSSIENTEPKGVTSVVTRTASRSQPDGSIKTTRSVKKQFVDGTEEHEESTETTPPPKAAQVTPTEQIATSPKKMIEKKGGWFWN